MTTTRALISTVLAVTVLATAVGDVARPARAGGAAQQWTPLDAPASCAPGVARNSAPRIAAHPRPIILGFETGRVGRGVVQTPAVAPTAEHA